MPLITNKESISLGIMQPYLFPYIGYFQLIKACDKFVIYDDVQYIKGGWVNRNRLLINGQDKYFNLPIKKGSTYLNINERRLSENISKDIKKILNQISNSYRKAPFFLETFSFIEEVFSCNEVDLEKFIFNSLESTCDLLKIKSSIIHSSKINYNRQLSGQDRVIEINKAERSTCYINAIGERDLNENEYFKKNKISLKFMSSNPIIYKQFNNEFIANLSIIDVLMFNSVETIQEYLSEYDLVDE